MIGIVEFFNNEAGWGKIVVEETGEGFFVHHRDIVDPKFFPDNGIQKFRTLKSGQRVEFDVQRNGRPMDAAINVFICSSHNEKDEISNASQGSQSQKN